MGALQAIWVSGSFKRKRKKAHIKNMATPLVPNFKNIGVALPQAQNLIGACSLYFRTSHTTYRHNGMVDHDYVVDSVNSSHVVMLSETAHWAVSMAGYDVA